MQNLIAFCSQEEAVSDVICRRFVRPIVSDKCVKFYDPHLNPSPEITPIHQRWHFFNSFVHNNVQPEVDSEVKSSVAIEGVSMDVRVKFGDSASNRSRGISTAHFVMDDER